MRAASIRGLAGSDTRRAAGLASAVMAGNFVALGFTVVFTHVLGASGYGSLAALSSAFIILMVPGTALQTTVAREISAALAAGDPEAGAALRDWISRLAAIALVAAVACAFGRHLLASAIGVDDLPWAAAAVIPSGALWLIVCVERGALQAFGHYRTVGSSIVAEQAGRLLFGYLLYAAGLGITGAFLGILLTLLALGTGLAAPLRPVLARAGAQGRGRLRALLAQAAWPVLALSLIAWLQDGHVIIVKHLASSADAGAWAAAAVAAKAIMWIAAGLALYLVPEAARRARTGTESRGVLLRTVAMIGALVLPMVAVYALAGRQLLHAVFGHVTSAAGALPLLALAIAALACTYLATQYQLALHRSRFIAALALAAIAQPVVLVAIGTRLTALASGLLALQLALALASLVLALGRNRQGSPAVEAEPALTGV
ncbi:MAG: hypothetical protein NVSMB25_24890 [Thermoleophilaceae bacterium]